MAASIPEFWQLLTDSRLVTAEQCQQLMASFGQVKGAVTQGNARTLAEWLISRGVLTRYQTMVLMAGRSGPFLYGDYKLYDRLESGALAGMFRAVHMPTQHPVVLQFLTGPATQDPRQWAALAPQLQVHSAVQHPHLQRCFEVVDLTSYRFLVVEDLRGQSVDQLLSGGQRLAPAEACRIVRCAALALTPLHQRGVAHGDIRPCRLWLEQGGNVKLLREPVNGFAPVFLSQPDAAGSLAPRADYLAPEFLQEGKSPDALTDIYALGCTLYELLAGQPPFPGADLRTKMHQHATQPIQPLDAVGVPQGLTQVVAYLMAKNPAVRYQHLNQVIAQVSPFVDPSRLNVASPKPPATQAAYERAIQQRQTAAPASAAPLPVRPASGAAGPTVARPAAVVPAAAGGPLAAPTAGTPAATGTAGSVLHGRQRHKPAQNKLLFNLAIAGGVVLLLLIVLIWLNSGTGEGPAKPRGGESIRTHSRHARRGIHPGGAGAATGPAGRRRRRKPAVVSRSSPMTANSLGSLRPKASRSRCATCPPVRRSFLIVPAGRFAGQRRGAEDSAGVGARVCPNASGLGNGSRIAAGRDPTADRQFPRPRRSPAASDAGRAPENARGQGIAPAEMGQSSALVARLGRHVHRRQRLVLPPAGRWPRPRVRRRKSGRNPRDPRRQRRFAGDHGRHGKTAEGVRRPAASDRLVRPQRTDFQFLSRRPPVVAVRAAPSPRAAGLVPGRRHASRPVQRVRRRFRLRRIDVRSPAGSDTRRQPCRRGAQPPATDARIRRAVRGRPESASLMAFGRFALSADDPFPAHAEPLWGRRRHWRSSTPRCQRPPCTTWCSPPRWR